MNEVTDTNFNMDGPWKYAEWKKPGTEDHICMISFIQNVHKRQINKDRKVD